MGQKKLLSATPASRWESRSQEVKILKFRNIRQRLGHVAGTEDFFVCVFIFEE